MPEASHAATRGADAYRESLVQLGAEGHLVSTLVQPTGPSAAVGVLFVNAGVIHRIGPHRIHVKIGRVLAQDGVPSLRLDLTGLGDSGRAGGTDGMLAQVRRDIRAALDLLAERTGLSRFVIIGICSGAEYGYQYALDDERVAGLVMVDGYSFGNRRTRMLRYLLRLRTLTWPVLKNAVLGRLARLRAGGGQPETPVDYGLPVLTVTDFGQGLAERARRGCPCYLVFTGSVLQRYNHASQFDDVMRAAPLSAEDRSAIARDVQSVFLPDIDHTMTTLHGQRVYTRHVRQWLAKQLA